MIKMFVIEIENNKGETLGSIEVTENNLDGEISFRRCNGVSVADIDFDDIFGTNNQKIRLQLE